MFSAGFVVLVNTKTHLHSFYYVHSGTYLMHVLCLTIILARHIFLSIQLSDELRVTKQYAKKLQENAKKLAAANSTLYCGFQ